MKQLIRKGNRSDQAADVQARLRALGFDIDDHTGFFGDATQRAVRAFQQRRGVIVDGIVGPHTWSELVEASWRLGDRNLYLKHPALRGDDVAQLQKRLNALGFDAGREDGIFGVDTARAVRAFQKEYGVPEDAIWGPRSHAALTGLRVDRPGVAADLREQLRRGQASAMRDALVVLDPGHGGADPGEEGEQGTIEADLCWDLATRLAGRLASAGTRVRFTRSETEGPDASERARRANHLGGDIFISLHFNAHEERGAEGASTYYFGSSKAGEALAECIQQELVNLGGRNCRSHARSYQVLRETRMPAVLVEPLFLTNPEEEKKAGDPDWRSALANAMLLGVERYFAQADG